MPKSNSIEAALKSVERAKELANFALQELELARTQLAGLQDDLEERSGKAEHDIIEEIVAVLREGGPMSDAQIVAGVCAASRIPVEDISRSLSYHSQDKYPRGVSLPPLVVVQKLSDGWVKVARKKARDIEHNGLPGNCYMLREQLESK